jgi:WD40 repeat protein
MSVRNSTTCLGALAWLVTLLLIPATAHCQLNRMTPSALVVRPSVKRGLESWTVETHLGHGGLHALASHPNGHLVAIGGGDSVIRLWDLGKSQLKNVLAGHSALVSDLAWSPDGTLLASGAYDDRVLIWDTQTGIILRVITCGTGGLDSVSWSSDGKLLATGGYGTNTLKIWNPLNGDLVKHLGGHRMTISSTAWSRDGKWLASASNDKTIRLWNTTTWKLDKVLTGHAVRVRCIDWSADSRHLVSADNASKIRVWNIDSGQTTLTLSGRRPIADISWSPDGKKIAGSSYDATMRIWNLQGTLERTITCHDASVMRVNWLGDGSRLVSVDREGDLCLSDATTGTLLKKIPSHHAIPHDLAWSPNGRKLAIACEDSHVRVWNIEQRQVISFSGHDGKSLSLAWSSDGEYLASGSADGEIQIRHIDSKKILRILHQKDTPVNALAWSPNKNGLLASAGGDGIIRLWNPHTGHQAVSLEGHAKGVYALDWSPSGELLVSGGEDRAVRIWNTASGKLQKTLGTHGRRIYCIAWSGDGQSLASTSHEELWLWKMGDGNVQSPSGPRKLSGHVNWVRDVAWSPDGSRLASTGRDRTLRFWDYQTGRNISTLRGHAGQIDSMDFSPNGRTIATASTWDGSVRLWNTRTGLQVSTLLPLQGGVSAIVDADGKNIVFPADAGSELVYLIRTPQGQRMMEQREFNAAFNIPVQGQ